MTSAKKQKLNDSNNLEYDVFLSFSGVQRDVAEELRDRIVEDYPKYVVFMDVYNAVVGHQVSKAFTTAISRSRYFIAIVCEKYCESKWTKIESRYADANRTIVGIFPYSDDSIESIKTKVGNFKLFSNVPESQKVSSTTQANLFNMIMKQLEELQVSSVSELPARQLPPWENNGVFIGGIKRLLIVSSKPSHTSICTKNLKDGVVHEILSSTTTLSSNLWENNAAILFIINKNFFTSYMKKEFVKDFMKMLHTTKFETFDDDSREDSWQKKLICPIFLKNDHDLIEELAMNSLEYHSVKLLSNRIGVFKGSNDTSESCIKAALTKLDIAK